MNSFYFYVIFGSLLFAITAAGVIFVPNHMVYFQALFGCVLVGFFIWLAYMTGKSNAN